MSAMCAGGVTGGGAVRKLSAPVYNTAVAVLTYGSPVAMNSGATAADEVLPVRAAISSDEAWGILLSQLGVGEAGEMMLAGVFTIPAPLVSGTSADYVKPDGAGGYVYSSSGSCRVLGSTADGIVVQHGAAAAASTDTYFKLSHRVELIESGGVQVETHYVDITNPGQVYAFGSTFAPPHGTVEVESGDMVYVEFGYFCDSGGEVRYTTTPIESGGILHPHMRLGSVTDSSVIQEYVSKESLLRLHQVFDGGTYIARPIISGGQAMLEIPGRVTDLGECWLGFTDGRLW